MIRDKWDAEIYNEGVERAAKLCEDLADSATDANRIVTFRFAARHIRNLKREVAEA